MQRIFSDVVAALSMVVAIVLWQASPALAGVLEEELLEESILEEELLEEEEEALADMADGMTGVDLGELDMPLPECDCVFPKKGVRIFGSLRPSLEYSDERHDHNFTLSPETDTLNVSDFESVVGIAAEQVVNDNLKVFGLVEIDANMGDSSKFGDLSQAFVGLENADGAFSIGTQVDPYFELIAEPVNRFNHTTSPHGLSGWSSGESLGDFLEDLTPEYSTDLLKYVYRKGGFALSAGLQANGHPLNEQGSDGDSDNANRYVDSGSLGIRWEGNGFHMGLAYREERRGDYSSAVRHNGKFAPYGYSNLALNASELADAGTVAREASARAAAAQAAINGQTVGNYEVLEDDADVAAALRFTGAARNVVDEHEKRWLSASLGVELSNYLYLGFAYQNTRMSVRNARFTDTFTYQLAVARADGSDHTIPAAGIVPGTLGSATASGRTLDAVLVLTLPEGVRFKGGYYEYDDGDAFNGSFNGYLMAVEKDLAKNAYVFAQLRHFELDKPQEVASSTLASAIGEVALGNISTEGNYDVLSIGFRYDFDLDF